MSYSGKVREELAELPLKNNCCRRAFICGLLFGAEVNSAGNIGFVLNDRSVADLCPALIKQQFGREPEIKEITRGGKPAFKVTFNSNSAAELLKKYSSLDDRELKKIVEFKCENDAGVYVRGVFCANGTVTDPNKNSNLEFHLPNERLADRLSDLLSEFDIVPNRSPMKSGCRIYFKRAEYVGAVIALIGAQSAYFEMSDISFINEVRANENRATNCVAANIKKSVSASAKQIEAIEKLMESPKYLSLPEDIKETAELRINNSEMSLSELAAAHTVPITKSGLNHRLLKLMAMAEEI